MSVISSQNLNDFLNQQSIKSCTSLNFNRDSSYEGLIIDNRPSGYGVFTWGNETFEGFFKDGVRVKLGIQKWNDGDEYVGEFYQDKRHGWGSYTWWNGDVYEGSFYKDMRHGYGKYKSNDGAAYEGTFYKNLREGFGSLRYKSGDVFKGLYKENYRCGPGILIYQNGCHDIGLWHRGSLLKLIINMDEVFQLSQFSELMTIYPNTINETSESSSIKSFYINDNDYSLDDTLKYRLTKPSHINIFKVDLNNHEKEILEGNFTERIDLDNKENDQQRNDEDITLNFASSELKRTIALIESEEVGDSHAIESRRDIIPVDYSFKEYFERLISQCTTTPLMFKIFNHISRFSKNIPIIFGDDQEIQINVVVKDVVTNIFNTSFSTGHIDRNKKYSPPGDIEKNSFDIITFSHGGNLVETQKLFSNGIALNPNVTDCRGSFSLLEAALTWNISLVNCLLDCGADINHITDEGISALGSCLLFYYPQKYFIETIAENVVTLNYTPMNFNGVRREPVKNPNLKIEDPSQGFIGTQLLETNDDKYEDTEQWDEYQSSVLPENVIDSNGQIGNPKNNLIKLNRIKSSDYKNLDFDSYRNNIEYPTKVGPKLLEKAASVLSNNSIILQRQPRPNSQNQNLSTDEGTARFKALEISRHNQMFEVILILLKRGANPNICKIPFPAIFFAVKSGDVEMTKVVIAKGSNVNACLGPKNKCLTPLHIASCLPGKRGVIITELLLINGADPNRRGLQDESFLDKTLIDEWSKDEINEEQKVLLGGKTPLHLACSRYDDYKTSYQIVVLLLQYGGNPNLICNGHTSLTLAIASGNDLIVDKLLTFENLDVNLSLTHGLGNAICVASSTSFEHSRTIEARISLIKKIISKSDILSPVAIGPKRFLGSATDYAYNIFFMDQRVSRLPYHALTSVERDLFNNRKNILSYMGMFTRECAVEKEKKRLESLKIEGIESRGPSPDFVWVGAGADPENQRSISKALSKISHNLTNLDLQMQGSDLLARKTLDASNRSRNMVLFQAPAILHKLLKQNKLIQAAVMIRKPLFKYCYECGRSVNVKLTACTRCKEVFFCSKLCKTKAWNTRHKFECLRVGGRSSIAGSERKNNRNIDSPTPATIMEDVTLTKEKIVLPKNDSAKQMKLKIMKDESESAPKSTQHPRKLPPLESKSHPSYSYAYVMDDYIKMDQQEKLIVLKNSLVDNYSYE